MREDVTTPTLPGSTATDAPQDLFVEPSDLQIEAEVKAAFDKWNDAWNRGDLQGYLDAYWDSPETRYVSESLKTVSFADGIVVRGKKNIDKVFTDVFVRSKMMLLKEDTRKGVAGMLSLVKLQVTPASTSNAVVFGEFKIDMTDSLSRTGVFTIHVRKERGLWVIVSEHATALTSGKDVQKPPGQCLTL